MFNIKSILFVCSLSIITSCNGQTSSKDTVQSEKLETIKTEHKMKIEIWSDVMCPFCYIGKRNFETALAQFADKEDIEVVWKSYQLDPTIPEVANDSYIDFMVKRKGMNIDHAKNTLANVANTAKQAGLDYNFDKALMVSSHKAHLLIQFAKTKDLGNEAEERLFKAFFTEGKNIADIETLTQLGEEIGLNKEELQAAFTDEKYVQLFKNDVQEAKQIGVSGVPFFVIDRKYAVSGAQLPQAFLETLEKSFAEWRKLNPKSQFEVIKGQSCTTDGKCD